MKSPLFKRIFIFLFAVSVTSFFLTIFFVFMTFKNNPDFLKQITTQFGESVTAGKDYQEIAEEDVHGLKKISFVSTHGDVTFQAYEGSTLKVDYFGKVPQQVTGPLILVKKDNTNEMRIELQVPESSSRFNIQWNNNIKGVSMSDVSLNTKVYIPKNFEAEIEISSVSGDVHMTNVSSTGLGIHSTNGDIELHRIKSSKVNINMTNGDFNSEGAISKNWTIENVRGDISLDIPENQFYQFELSSLNGNIENTVPAPTTKNTESIGNIRIKTVSGDIKIEKHSEHPEDRD